MRLYRPKLILVLIAQSAVMKTVMAQSNAPITVPGSRPNIQLVAQESTAGASGS